MGVAGIAAGVGAVGSIAGGLMSSGAAKDAAATQAAAADRAAQLTHEQYLQTRQDLSPYRDIGALAFDRLGQLYGLTPRAPIYGPGGPGGGGGNALSYSSTPGATAAGYNGYSGGGTLQDYINAGRTDLPNGYSLAYNGEANQWMVVDKDGQPNGWMGPVNSPLQQVFDSVAPGTFNASASGGAPAGGGGDIIGYSNPFADYGLSGLTYHPEDYGLGNGVFNPANYGLGNGTFQPTQEFLESTPGYQFTRSQGLKAVQNSATARGQGVSGAAQKAAAQYATGLADNTLTTQANIFNQNLANARNVYSGNLANTQGIFQQNLSNILNPLLSYAQMGQNAAAQTGAAGAGAINAQSNLLTGAANAQAAGTIGSANAMGNALGSLGQAPLNYMLYNNLFSGGGGGGYIDTTSTF